VHEFQHLPTLCLLPSPTHNEPVLHHTIQMPEHAPKSVFKCPNMHQKALKSVREDRKIGLPRKPLCNSNPDVNDLFWITTAIMCCLKWITKWYRKQVNKLRAKRDSKFIRNGLYAQLHYFLNFSQLLVSCCHYWAKLINSGVSDYCCCDYWG